MMPCTAPRIAGGAAELVTFSQSSFLVSESLSVSGSASRKPALRAWGV